ncbi:response regulator [Ideonella livida]|uniref:Response regulator transcription factor n=1 Tax=Ideonella livida TaxID=2707176 RepID=A0A7C9PF56_9BURK|nr:response regulator transcription factor [Ideonella livida]NDY89852.1 response regulator transcription factor [Ideonella livida]
MIRVMLVDDHAVVREGYRRLLECQGDLQVVAEAGDGQQALQDWRHTQPDVTVVDLALPGLGGLELITRLRQREPRCRLLAFSMHRDPVWATQALRAGALGYVTKSSPPETLVQAVRTVHDGRRVISPDIATEVATALLDAQGAETGAPAGLSPREFEVLRALVAGREVADIAEALHLSPKTVHNLHYQIKAKLGTRSDFELARLAWQNGWMDA